ncbi:MAG TPA: hypothetical protein VE404_09685 [Verrucomicrobiae bacterium]|nr:hypothetical protein [Verrucomicrobiae bacterium]
MIPWKELGRATIPGQPAPLVLSQRDTEFVLRVGPHLLMSSRSHGTEEILAELAWACIGGRPAARMLIGGLGMGFTLAAALRHAPPDATLTVVELVGEVIEWNRGPLAHLAGRPLDDPRVSVCAADVADALRDGPLAFDAILLDVDNGPSGLSRTANDGLYSHAGLRAAHRALREGGVVGVWSVAPDPKFTQRLGEVGFEVKVHVARARRNKGGRHTLWIATRRGTDAARQ